MYTTLLAENIILVKDMIKSLFDDNEIEVLERPASYIIKLKHEVNDKIVRIILLPPNGFTANRINETLPHPEVRRAKIEIKGGVRPNKQGFSILKNVVKFAYYTKRNIEVEANPPYALIDKNSPYYEEEIKSSKEDFFVVKENGEGFYHNLINISGEWLLLILEKELRLQKEMNINSKVRDLNQDKKRIIIELVKGIKHVGDRVFEEQPALIANILRLGTTEAIPPLIEALNIYESGNHEPCTVYAIILKFAKKDPKGVLKMLEHALEHNEAPKYYLKELLEKTSKWLPVLT